MSKKNSNENNNSFNIDEIPLTDMYEGVVYEPSYKENKNVSTNKNNKGSQKFNSKIKRSQKFNFKNFLTIIILSGIAIFGTVFFLTYTVFFPNFSFKSTSQPKISLEEAQKKEIESALLKEPKNILGVIKNIDYAQKMIEISDLKYNKKYDLTINGNTSLKDKYDKSLTIKEFRLGDVVDFSFNEDGNLRYLKQNSETIEYKSIKNLAVDEKNKLIKFENKIFSYDENLKVTRNLDEFSLENLSPLDSLNLKIYDEIVYSIEIEKSHGNLVFENRDGFLNSTVEIDTDIFKSLAELEQISLTEGYHKVVIKGDHLNTFIKDVYISPDQDIVLNLSEIQKKSGLLLINSNVSDYILYVNNEIKSTNEPLQLTYGAYKIKLQKTGYTSFESEIVVNKPQTYLTANLTALEYAGKITLNSNPDGAEVFVDNVFVGYTPLTHKTSYGNHKILFKKNGYKNTELGSVNVSEKESEFNILLQKDESENQQNIINQPIQNNTPSKPKDPVIE